MVSLLKEQDNFLRNAILTVDHSKEALQCFIEQHLKNNHQTFADFLNQNQHEIYHLYYDAKCCQCGPEPLQRKKRTLFASQMKLLFDENRQLSVHKITRRSDFCCCYAKKNVTTAVLDLTLARCLLVNCCIDMFWYSCLDFKGVTLEQFLNSNKHILYHLWKGNTKCCKCQPNFIFPSNAPIIIDSEWNQMFSSTLLPCENDRKRPVSGNISMCSFAAKRSITVQQMHLELQKIIIQYCSSTRNSVEKLAELRNVTFGHVKKASMSCTEFNTFIREAKDAILDLATVCGKKDDYKQRLLNLRDKPLDSRIFCQYEKVLLQTISNYEDILEENETLKDVIKSLQNTNAEIKEKKENLYELQAARSSVPMDVLCDGIHLVCFTDTRLDMKCVYYTDSFIKVKTTLHGQESSLLKCDGHLIHCIQDERLSRTFKSINDKAVKSIICEDPTIPDFVKLTYIYGLIKRKEFSRESWEDGLIKHFKRKEFSRESWEDMLKFTIVNKKPVFCYFLLANAENIMTTDQPKFHDILQQALCNAMTNQDKETARGISWFIVRKFYRSLSSSLKETIIDTWPSFECKCDNRNMRKTVPNFCSSSMIIIIETEKAGNDFPKTFWKVNVKYIVNDKIDKNECKEIHKKLQTSLSEVHFLNKVVISGVDAKTVFTEHSNLTLICKSAFKSKGFLKDEHEFVDVPCVQLYCKSKGVIPVGESHFPKTICGLQTDILEGSPCYLAGIRVGDEIGTDEFKRGTLGGFLLIRGVKTFLTCLHVFLNADELSADNISLNDEKLSMVKLYPRSSAVQNSHECGYIRDIAFQVDNEKETSIDAALIEFTAGTSIDSQDYMALDNGKLSYADVGMNSDYLNNSCVDYRPLCFSTPRPILQTVSVGAVSGFSDCKISEVLENKEKFVDLESIEDLYSNVVLDEVRAKAKLIISYFQSITLANIPDEQTIVQYIEQTCDPDISAEIKVILCNIVKNVYLKLQSNTNECVENIIQEVSLHHTHSSFSAIIGNVHMQKVFIRKTGDNMAVKRIKRRVYNQLHISNIPFKPGDSGTCIYVLSPVRGCIGMAIANHPLGGCIATPIMEILKHFKIGIK